MPELGWRDAIIEVLKTADEPMHYTDIAQAVADRGLKTSFGATPAASVATTISISIQHDREASPFIKVSRGYYALKGNTDAISGVEATKPDEVKEEEAGLINAFGMYWRRDNVIWTSTPKILGQQQSSSDPVDFHEQKGVYLLHDGSKVVYVGRTTDQPLGLRLKQHTGDRLNGRWDRFSWFGVFEVSEDGGLSSLPPSIFNLDSLIATMEALLIEGLEPPQNRKRGDDFSAVEFIQVEDPAVRKSQIVQLIDRLKAQL